MGETEKLLDLVKPLLRQAGFTQGTWSASLVSRRNDRAMHRIVVKLVSDSGPVLIAKHLVRPVDCDGFVNSVDRQAEVAATGVRAPAIRAVDRDRQIVLMDFVPGLTLYDACHLQQASAHAPFLAASGRWVDQFHRAVRWERRTFRAKFTVSSLSELNKHVRSRDKHVPKRADFLSMLEATLDAAAAVDGCQTVAAIGHGDLNLRNIIIDGDGASGLDFGAPGMLPVAHDLARLFCHYGTLCVKPGRHRNGPLPAIDLSSFYHGYKLVPPDDLSVAFMCRVRLLRDWAKIPQRATDRTVAEHLRLKGIHKLAQQFEH